VTQSALKQSDLPHYTLGDYEQWEGNWELIRGIPYAMAPAPSWLHQELNGNIYSALKVAIGTCDHCKPNLPVNLKIAEDTIVQPDVVVVCKPFKEGLYLEKMPDLVVEILSPSTSDKDLNLKYELYRDAGIKYYIIVHPIDKTATVFCLDPNSGNQYLNMGIYTSESYRFDLSGCSFDFDFSSIW